jgi:hypothetical protein
MPYGDGTGPLGEGPQTGRGLGYCAGYDGPGYAWGPGGGFGGRGRGRGHRNWYYRTGLTGWQRGRFNVGPVGPWYGAPALGWGWTPTKEQQITSLKAQADNLESVLSEVRRELSELEDAGE